MAEENKTQVVSAKNEQTTDNAVKIVTIESLEVWKNEVKQHVNEQAAELKVDIEKQLADIKASHDNVTDTTKNKYGAYFFRAVEVVTLVCVVYSVFNHLF